MRITDVHIENFNRLGNVRVDFSKLRRLVMIAGSVSSGGASSNGAGKSSLFHAIAWCLFGKEPQRPSGRTRPASSMIRHGTKFCRVSVTLQDDRGEWTVTRARSKGGVSVAINGKGIDTTTGGLDLIEARLGMSRELFLHAIMFSGDTSAFCRLPPAERTALLEQMLGIKVYAAAKEGAVKDSNELASDVARMESDIARMREAIDVLAEEASREASQAMEEISRIRMRRREAKAKLRSAKREESERAKALASIAETNADAISQYEKELREHKDRSIELQARLTGAITATRESSELAMRAENGVQRAKTTLKEMERSNETDMCPACKRPFTGRVQKTDLTPYIESLALAEKTLARRQSEKEQCEDAVNRLQSSLRKHTNNAPQPPQNLARDDAQRAFNEALRDLSRAREEYRAAKQEHDRDHFSTYRQLVADCLQKTAMCEMSERRLACLKLDKDAADFWKVGFGRNGIPAMLISDAVPALNTYIAPFVQAIGDGAYAVSFEVADEAQTSALAVRVTHTDGGESYDDMSKGELARVDLCILLAVRALMLDRARVKFDQIFIDELLDGLDEVGMEKIIALLSGKKIAGQVVFISHDPVLQDAAETVVTLTKRAGVTSATVS